MYKTILICMAFIIALTISNCKWFDSNDEQVKQNTTDIKELKTTASNKADKNDIKALEAYNKECDQRHVKSEDRLTALEKLKATSKIEANKSKTKKTCTKTIKNAKKVTDINDIVAGYGENELDPYPQADIDELSQPKTILIEKKDAIVENKNADSVNSAGNLVDFMKKQEQLVKSGLDTVQKRCESTEKLLDQNNTALETHKDMIEKFDLQLNNHQLAIDEHRKTLESHGVELKQAKDFQVTTESRLRVLESDIEKIKHNSNVTFDSIDYLKKEVGTIKEELKAEETPKEEDKEKEEGTEEEESNT